MPGPEHLAGPFVLPTAGLDIEGATDSVPDAIAGLPMSFSHFPNPHTPSRNGSFPLARRDYMIHSMHRPRTSTHTTGYPPVAIHDGRRLILGAGSAGS